MTRNGSEDIMSEAKEVVDKNGRVVRMGDMWLGSYGVWRRVDKIQDHHFTCMPMVCEEDWNGDHYALHAHDVDTRPAQPAFTATSWADVAVHRHAAVFAPAALYYLCPARSPRPDALAPLRALATALEIPARMEHVRAKWRGFQPNGFVTWDMVPGSDFPMLITFSVRGTQFSHVYSLRLVGDVEVSLSNMAWQADGRFSAWLGQRHAGTMPDPKIARRKARRECLEALVAESLGRRS